VSLQKAREQHTNYINVLKQHLEDGKVINLPAIESHPDCLFVEDTMIAIDDTAVITSMGHESRRGEVDSIKRVLLEDLQGRLKNVYDMNDNNEADNDSNINDVKEILPTCDGGDVLYTGRHLFVGITDRTNEIGFEHLRKVFAQYQGLLKEEDVIPIHMMSIDDDSSGKGKGGGVLHLKSAVTHVDEETILLPEGHLGDVLQDVMRANDRGYKTIRLPDVLSCNAVVINGHVLAQDSPCSVSKCRIENACLERNMGLTFVDTSELAKKDAALTCCSVLLSV
jgi:dimethylargininase